MRVPEYMIAMGVFSASFSLGWALMSWNGTQQKQALERERLATVVSLQEIVNRRGASDSAQTSSGFPNIPLRTQDNREVLFYDDLVKNKIVVINFMYTRCEGICPLSTANLAKVHRLLGDRVGRDIQLLSISLDPEVDTPEVLKRYAEAWGNKKGWTYLTGRVQDVDLLRRRMGLYDADASVDIEKISHTGLVTFGNDKTGRWAALPVALNGQDLAQAILRITQPMEN